MLPPGVIFEHKIHQNAFSPRLPPDPTNIVQKSPFCNSQSIVRQEFVGGHIYMFLPGVKLLDNKNNKIGYFFHRVIQKTKLAKGAFF